MEEVIASDFETAVAHAGKDSKSDPEAERAAPKTQSAAG
jgi:hypothetical protein